MIIFLHIDIDIIKHISLYLGWIWIKLCFLKNIQVYVGSLNELEMAIKVWFCVIFWDHLLHFI